MIRAKETKPRKPYKKREINPNKPVREKKTKKDYEINTSEEVNVHEWKVSALAQKALNAVQKAVILRGCNRDTAISLMVKEEDKALFTNGVHTRLLAVLRALYNEIILIELETEEEIEKRRIALLVMKAKKAAYRKEQEYKKSLTNTV